MRLTASLASSSAFCSSPSTFSFPFGDGKCDSFLLFLPFERLLVDDKLSESDPALARFVPAAVVAAAESSKVVLDVDATASGSRLTASRDYVSLLSRAFRRVQWDTRDAAAFFFFVIAAQERAGPGPRASLKESGSGYMRSERRIRFDRTTHSNFRFVGMLRARAQFAGSQNPPFFPFSS